MMEIFGLLRIAYYTTSDASVKYNFYWHKKMIKLEMMIETRPRYPSNKKTFTIANITKGKIIPYIDIILNPFAKFDADVDVFLEDTRRNFPNSFCCFFPLT